MLTGIGLGLLAALCGAVAHLLGKACLRDMSLVYLLKVRTAAAAAATLCMAVALGHYGELRQLELRQFALIAAGGVLSPLIISSLLLWSLQRMPLNLNNPLFRSSPLFALMWSAVLLDEKLTGPVFIGVGLVVAGVAFFSWSGARGSEERRPVGPAPIVAALMAAMLFGLTMVLWKTFRQWASGTTINTIQCAVGSLVWLGVDACTQGRCPRTPGLMVRAALSGILVFGAGNVFSIMALGHIVAPAVTALSATSTLMVGVLAQVYLRERWSPLEWLFALVIVAGVGVLAIG